MLLPGTLLSNICDILEVVTEVASVVARSGKVFETPLQWVNSCDVIGYRHLNP